MYKLTQYDSIKRLSDNASIPNDPANRDYVEYQKWLKDGNKPSPADVVEIVDVVTDAERLDALWEKQAGNSTKFDAIQAKRLEVTK
jgi:hypothetical protein